MVGTAVGTLSTGDVKGGSTGANAAFAGVTNNHLKHDESQRMAALKEKKLYGQCDTACQQDIETLTKIDQERNAQLDACRGVSSPVCNTARQEVRNAAAEYLRKETFALNSGTDHFTLENVYASEKNETFGYAQDTMDGKTTGMTDGAANAASSIQPRRFTAWRAIWGMRPSATRKRNRHCRPARTLPGTT